MVARIKACTSGTSHTCITIRDYVIDYTVRPESMSEGCCSSLLPPSPGLLIPSLISFSPIISSLLVDTSRVIEAGEVCYISTVKLSSYDNYVGLDLFDVNG